MNRMSSAPSVPAALSVAVAGAGLWRSAAWRWSLAAGLALHGGLGALWWWTTPAPTHAPAPMVVRWTTESATQAPRHAGVAAKPSRPQGTPDTARARASTSVPAAVPFGGRQPQAPQAVQAAPVMPAAAPTAQAPTPTATTATPTAATPPTVAQPTVANANHATHAPAAAAATAVATPGPGASPSVAEARSNEPMELDSAAVRYLVQPVLTFPDGEDLGEYGTVKLRVLVDEKGKAIDVKTLQSSGYARLDQHAVRVIRRARFMPGVSQGETRQAWATVNLHFRPPGP